MGMERALSSNRRKCSELTLGNDAFTPKVKAHPDKLPAFYPHASLTCSCEFSSLEAATNQSRRRQLHRLFLHSEASP